MKIVIAVILLCLFHNMISRHVMNEERSHGWLAPGGANTGNALNSWLGNLSNSNGNTAGSNPAFGNWLNNNNNQPRPNPTFGNWLNNNNGPNPGNGVNPLNDGSFANPLRGQIGGAGANNINANDNAFRAFLQANNVPNATQLPTLQECARYTIRAGGNPLTQTPDNYRITCTLPNGRNYTETCYGKQSCDYLTCKFLKCSQVPGGKVYRVKI